MTESFPTRLVGPTSKERKYDRQLRLWAASGQQALEESQILLVNSDGPLDSENAAVSGVVGVEALKNLVLPGIGGFTIVDPAVVTEPDLGVNFFLGEESLGRSRAEETCNFLRELNPDVAGGFYKEPILELLKDENFLRSYKLVVITGPMRDSAVKTVCDAARKCSIPVIYTHSVGFYSAFSLQLPSVFPVVETHPDQDSIQDLRLLNPWPELAEAAAKLKDLDSFEDHQHDHVPYLLLLLHYLEKWKEGHGGSPPTGYKEKTEFRDLVRAGARTNNSEGGEENFDEAAAAVLKTISPWTLSSSLREIFDIDQCTHITPTSDNFWIIASAIKSFYTSHSVLPLPGSLPDMKARSVDYISLQNIYKAKARKDLAEVVTNVRATEAFLKPSRQSLPISEKEIETFCKNAAHIKVIRGRDIPQLCPDATNTIKAIRSSLGNPESLIPIFVALQVLDALVTEYQETKPSPSSPPFLDEPTNWSATLSKLLALLTANHNTLNGDALSRIEMAVEEVKRAGAGELHNISSLTGGLVAQEALKVLTRQYVPLDNTCVFDGVRAKSEMFRL